MATRNKRRLAALNKENCEEHTRSNLAENSSVPRSQEDYVTQVSEEIERRVTKKLSQEFSRTENRLLGALARLHSGGHTYGHLGTKLREHNTFSTFHNAHAQKMMVKDVLQSRSFIETFMLPAPSDSKQSSN